MSIIMYTGRPGTGKTYFGVNDIVSKYLNKGKIVYSNINIEWNGFRERHTWYKTILILLKLRRKYRYFPKSNLIYWQKLNELFEVSDGIIFIDEAHVYMNSRRWKGLPEEMERKLAQHRKEGLHIIGTVQNVNRLDVIFRELIDYWYVCEKFMGFIIATEFDIDEDKMHKKGLRKKLIRLSKRRFLLYDTLAKVKVEPLEIKK